MQEAVNTIIFLGRPGSGKGTQARLLSDATGWPIFSSGSRVRELASTETAVGRKVKGEHDSGQLSPDWLVNHFFVKELLTFSTDTGFICEGFPRNVAQARLAHEAFAWLNRPYLVITLEVNEAEALKRQLSRAKEERRVDSDEARKIETRFAVYREQTEPVTAFFKEKEKLIEVNGEQSREQIFEEIRRVVTLA